MRRSRSWKSCSCFLLGIHFRMPHFRNRKYSRCLSSCVRYQLRRSCERRGSLPRRSFQATWDRLELVSSMSR